MNPYKMYKKGIMTDTLFWVIVAVIILAISIFIISGIRNQSCDVISRIFTGGC